MNSDTTAIMQDLLARQQRAFVADLPVSESLRKDRLGRAIDLLLGHRQALCEAMDTDFGGRPAPMSALVDIMTSVTALKHARRHLREWMKPRSRGVRFPLRWLGAKAWVEYQPKGVVGLISPWNFPVYLTFAPLADILAAGNRVMIKPSELTAHTAALMQQLLADYFDAEEVSVCLGDADVGRAFSALPFDHLLFTGSSAVGRHVMRAAADNLTPVTLELGGKSPAIVSASADLAQAAERLVLGKLTNAGQVCLAPDYVLVEASRRDGLIEHLKKALAASYRDLDTSPDYAAIINDRHQQRLLAYLDQARQAGATLITVGGWGDIDRRRMPLTLVLDPSPELQLMGEELFGPILPLVSYHTIDQAIAHINAAPRPLALYYFGRDRRQARYLLDRTIAGGVTLNDVMFHVTADSLPFGGVGASGMGAYHGIEGFRGFSHAKSVYRQSPWNISRSMGLSPPYGKRLQRLLRWELRR